MREVERFFWGGWEMWDLMTRFAGDTSEGLLQGVAQLLGRRLL